MNLRVGKKEDREMERDKNGHVLMGEGASEVIRSPTAASLLRIYRSFAGLCSQFVGGYDAETRVNLSRVFALCELLLLFIAFSARLLLFFRNHGFRLQIPD
ncbi:uncharacterized [Tachysurus ichikawai]